MTLAKGTPSIIKGKDYFSIVTYEGNGGGQTVGNFVPFTDSGTIAKSVIYNRGDSPKLSKTPGSDGNRKTFTISVWYKPTDLGTDRTVIAADTSASGSNYAMFKLNTNNKIFFYSGTGGGGDVITTRTFEDTSKFYHFLIAVDTTQATASNRVKIYVDGDQITAFDSASYPSQDGDLNFNSTSYPMAVGSFNSLTNICSGGHLAEFNFVDGTALTPSTFGLTDTSTGRWIPKSLTGITYGTNGFRMQFANSAGQTIGDDTSGQGNDYAVSNLAATDIVTDSPTQNFATFDPLDSGNNVGATPGTATLAEGGTRVTAGSNPSNWDQYRTNKPLTSGKWYVEVTLTSLNTASYFGVISRNQNIKGGGWYSDQSTGWSYDTSNGKTENSNNGYITYGSARSQGHVVGIAVDLDNGNLWFSEQGTYPNSGNPATGANPAYSNLKRAVQDGGLCFTEARGYSGHNDWNFGQRSYAHTPPTGFSAVQQDNYPDEGVKPDMVWVKNREQTDYNTIYDTSRGHSKELYPNETAVEASAVADGLKKFVKGGFTTEDAVNLNSVGESFVGWMWTCNSGTTAANTDGSGATLASTIQVNQTAGFSMVRYDGSGTGSTVAGKVAHGLGKKPDWIMVKCETHAHEWTVYHVGSSDPSDKVLYLNATNAETDWPYFGDTDPTSSVFTVSSDLQTGRVNYDYIAYCWTAIEGFSKFGAYVGNASTNGPFVNLGFRPSWLMIKRLDSTNNWQIFDSNRNKFNPVDLRLYADITNAEAQGTSTDIFDFTANGFKVREDNAAINASSGRYLYCAFADHPLIGNGTNPVTAF